MPGDDDDDDDEQQQQGSDDDEDEPAAGAGVSANVLRCDIARGMQISVPAELVLTQEFDAPPLVVAFALDDPTAIPRLATEAIWAVNFVRSSLERGEACGAYLTGGVNDFTLQKQPRRKHVIRHGNPPQTIPEIVIQARVHELTGVVGARRVSDRYFLLVVRSPQAFSMRLATYFSCEGRGVDERVAVWSKLAMHVRSGVPPRLPVDALLRTYEESLDWMRTSDAGGFTCLFSMHTAIDWIRNHFLRRNRGVQHIRMEGLVDELDDNLMQPTMEEQYSKYDQDVNKRVMPSTDKKKKRRRAEEDDEGEQEGAEAEVDYAKLPMSPVEYPMLTEGDAQGLPKSLATIEIITPTRHEQAVPLLEFVRHLRAFPESVMMELLRGCMHALPQQLMTDMTTLMRSRCVPLTMPEVRDIIMGSDEYQLGRPMLCLGDESWGKQIQHFIHRHHDASKRLSVYMDFLRVSFALAYTRSTGSDGYTDARVSAYGRYMLHNKGIDSRKDCRKLYEQSTQAFPAESVPASATHRAWRLALEMILQCDRRVWNLRPDNLFLFMHLLFGDLMLCLNFFGSVIDGAFNGVGGTIVVRDGGGSYYTRYQDRAAGVREEGAVMQKGNTTGADHSTNSYKLAIDIGNYAMAFRPEGEIIQELKRVTETSLIQETCNVYEGHAGNLRVKHVITHTGDRKYSTELKTGGDQQSENCMTAVAWILPRNTRAKTANDFTTTRENDKKERVQQVFRQVKGAYLIICSNNVRQGARERYHTMITVSRSITSAAGGVDLGYAASMGQGLEDDAAKLLRKRRSAMDGRVDRMMCGGDQTLGDTGRGVFFNALGVAFYTGFMQWTGMLGQIRETRTTAALLMTFDAHLVLCHDILNPAMASSSDRSRYREISKSRGIAASLLGISMRETIEAGRLKEPQQTAIERACLAFKVEGGEAACAWIMGDTMEHMLRLDFFLIMLILARKAKVPVVTLDALLTWLDTGAGCPEADAFVATTRNQYPTAECDTDKRGPGADVRPAHLCLMYLPLDGLTINKLDTPFTPEVRTFFCEAVAKRLHKEFAEDLQAYCQIKPSQYGTDIVRGMIEHSIDQMFAWPSVLMPHGPPRAFWNLHLPQPVPNEDTALPDIAPLRMYMKEATSATLAADVRWLLLVNALGQGQITQSARFTIVAQLLQRFYYHCVPPMLTMSANDLFVALPTQVVGAGFVWPPLLPTTRRILRRPGPDVGMDAHGCPTGMIEDMGVAAPRYELAAMLGVRERDLPTPCVNYHFPAAIWTPAILEVTKEPVSLMWEGGRFFIQREHEFDEDMRHDITGGEHLGGRVAQAVRPVCAFYRPGTLVAMDGGIWGGVGELQGGVYLIHLPGGQRTTTMTPYEIEARVLKPNAPLWVRAGAFPPAVRFVGQVNNNNDDLVVVVSGTLESLDVEDVPYGHFALRVKRAGHEPPRGILFGASHGNDAFRECALRDAPRFIMAVGDLRAQPAAGVRVLDTIV
jgi:hypothetical protein